MWLLLRCRDEKFPWTQIRPESGQRRVLNRRIVPWTVKRRWSDMKLRPEPLARRLCVWGIFDCLGKRRRGSMVVLWTSLASERMISSSATQKVKQICGGAAPGHTKCKDNTQRIRANAFRRFGLIGKVRFPPLHALFLWTWHWFGGSGYWRPIRRVDHEKGSSRRTRNGHRQLRKAAGRGTTAVARARKIW